jgi:HEAT repeat protein
MDDTRALIREAQDPKTTPDRLAELAKSPDDNVRRTVARNGATPAPSLAALLADPSWEVRAMAAHAKKAPHEQALSIVETLAASSDVQQRRLAARSPLASPALLTKLVDDGDTETRSNAAKNPKTPAEAARARLTDGEPSVVLGALAHPSVTREERRAFVNEDLLTRFFEAHADGDVLFEALCERFLWDVLERTFPDPERFDDVWQELVQKHFELIEIPSRNTVLAGVHRDHWKPIITRLASEIRGGERQFD